MYQDSNDHLFCIRNVYWIFTSTSTFILIPLLNWITFYPIKFALQSHEMSFVNVSNSLVLPSRQILVPRTSRGRPPPTSLGRPLKILSDCPGDVPIWRPEDVPIWRPREVLKWLSEDVLIRRLRDVPGRRIWDVPRTFSGCPLEDLQSTQTWMS